MSRYMSRQQFVKLGAASFATSLPLLSPVMTSPGSAQRPSSTDPDGESIACMIEDDTECAVKVWEAEFEQRPFDDYVRDSLYASHMIHAVRSIDRGYLRGARQSVERAKEIVPRSDVYAYWDELLRLYDRNVLSYQMAGWEFLLSEERDIETRYAEIPAILGGQTSTFAMTIKTDEFFYSYTLGASRQITGDFALRCLVYPMSANGQIYLVFSKTRTSSMHVVITMDNTYSSYWQLGESTEDDYFEIGSGGYIDIYPEQWTWLEVRVRGNTVELWHSTQLIGQEIVLDYEQGDAGFGVGLNYGGFSTFSAAFDDVNLYSLDSGGSRI